MFISVDLPEPDVPMMATISPAPIVTSTPRSARTSVLPMRYTFSSPRASINLILAGRSLAYVRGRDYALPQDVLDMALDVMRHRLVLKPEADLDGLTADQVRSCLRRLVSEGLFLREGTGRTTRFVASVSIVTFKDVNIEELPKKEL